MAFDFFFNWYDKVGLFFFFFQYIYFPLDSDSLYILIFKSLARFFFTGLLFNIYIYNLTKQQLYGQLPSIPQTILVRRIKHAGHCCLSRSYIQHLCTDSECSLEDLSEVMDDLNDWLERVREFRAISMT